MGPHQARTASRTAAIRGRAREAGSGRRSAGPRRRSPGSWRGGRGRAAARSGSVRPSCRQHRGRRLPGTCVLPAPTLVRGTRATQVPYDLPSQPLAGGGDHLDTPHAADDATGIGATAIGRALPPSLVFGSAIGLSAFLLFTVQPLVGRLLLPGVRRRPAVWATVLAFFQVVLLGGYAYAHVVATRLSPNRGAALHLTMLSGALVFTLLDAGLGHLAVRSRRADDPRARPRPRPAHRRPGVRAHRDDAPRIHVVRPRPPCD